MQAETVSVVATSNGNGEKGKKRKRQKKEKEEKKGAEALSTSPSLGSLNGTNGVHKEKKKKKKDKKKKKNKKKAESKEKKKRRVEEGEGGNGHKESSVGVSESSNGHNEENKNVTSSSKKRKEGKSTDKKGKKKNKKAKKSETSSSSSSTQTTMRTDNEKEAESVLITGTGSEAFGPISTFTQAATLFPENILGSIPTRFEKPTLIQSSCWSIVCGKRDLVGIAQTGSGKTLAFLLPALLHIVNTRSSKKKDKRPTVLILSPTRELAMQTSDVCDEVAVEGISSVCVYGGVDKAPQRAAFRRGVDVVIACPGRLLDLFNDGTLKFDNISYLVLDEADRMLDLGFVEDIRKIIRGITCPRQTLMFSATWPVEIQSLASEFLSDPIRVSIGRSEDESKLVASQNVTQIVEVIDNQRRDGRLLELLRKYHSSRKNRVLVFVLYKKEAVRVERMLQSKGWNAAGIHGDKDQANRTRAMEDFKSGKMPLLVATDVAARGLDVPNIEYVINYSFPLTIEDYVHRIGRTGRGGSKGVSYTMFTTFDKGKAGELVNVLREANQEIPEALLKFGTHVKKKEHALYGAHFRAAGTGVVEEAKHIKFD